MPLPIGAPRGITAAEARGADSLVGGIATGGVGEQKIFLGIDVVKQRFFVAIEIHPAYCNRDHFRAAGCQSPRSLLEGFVFTCPYDEAGAERAASDCEGVGHVSIVMKGESKPTGRDPGSPFFGPDRTDGNISSQRTRRQPRSRS